MSIETEAAIVIYGAAFVSLFLFCTSAFGERFFLYMKARKVILYKKKQLLCLFDRSCTGKDFIGQPLRVKEIFYYECWGEMRVWYKLIPIHTHEIILEEMQEDLMPWFPPDKPTKQYTVIKKVKKEF